MRAKIQKKLLTSRQIFRYAVPARTVTKKTLVAILCETLMSAKQAINDKLQGSVATYLRCGGVVNNHIKKGLLLSLRVNKFF